jgi:hypothetical protein
MPIHQSAIASTFHQIENASRYAIALALNGIRKVVYLYMMHACIKVGNSPL